MPFVSVRDGRIRSVKLEFNLVDHCNFSCAECSHFSPHLPKSQADLASFERDLRALAEVYAVDRFRFVGGEPLLHKQILSFIRAVRSSGIAREIEICSNGSLAERVDDEVFRAIDSLSISWYPDPRCNESTIAAIRQRCQRLGTRLKVDRIQRFRMMQLDSPIQDSATTAHVHSSCQIAHSWYCQTIYNGRFYLCSRPIFTNAYLAQRGRVARDLAKLDGIDLHAEHLRDRLLTYLRSDQALESCRHCLGTVGKHVPWRQLPPEDRMHGKPTNRDPAQSIAAWRMRYLLAWAWLERVTLGLVPSLRISRALNLLKSTTVRD